MKSTEKRVKFFKDICFLVVWAHKRHIQLMPIWFHRTPRQQADLYSKGRGIFPDKNRIVTYVDGVKRIGSHQKWLGMDLVVIEKGKILWASPKYDIVGKKWASLGHKWGGNFKRPKGDVGHFQL